MVGSAIAAGPLDAGRPDDGAAGPPYVEGGASANEVAPPARTVGYSGPRTGMRAPLASSGGIARLPVEVSGSRVG